MVVASWLSIAMTKVAGIMHDKWDEDMRLSLIGDLIIEMSHADPEISSTSTLPVIVVLSLSSGLLQQIRVSVAKKEEAQ